MILLRPGGKSRRAVSGLVPQKEEHEMTKQRVTQLALAVCGLAFLILGAAQGGYQTTMAKAVRICMECIGIG